MICRSIFALLFLAATARADTVYLLDGTSREGIVETHNDAELHLRVERDGIAGTLTIPMAQISRAVISHRNLPAPAAQPAPAAPTTGDPFAPAPPPAPPPMPALTDVEQQLYRDHGAITELAYAAAGHGLDDLGRLPAAIRDLWTHAARSDLAGHRAETLDNLRMLEAAMHTLPDGITRIDAVTRLQRSEGLGVWMARTHWEWVQGKNPNGPFDFEDVREIERPALIGYLKEKTGPALEPLKSYFPPIDEKTGQPEAFRMSQLQGISASNALDVKEKAALAAAVLLAQLKLEPAMPAVDKGLLYNQLATVNRIRARASDLETLARAAILRAEQEKKAADEKARRDAAITARKTAAPK